MMSKKEGQDHLLSKKFCLWRVPALLLNAFSHVSVHLKWSLQKCESHTQERSWRALWSGDSEKGVRVRMRPHSPSEVSKYAATETLPLTLFH